MKLSTAFLGSLAMPVLLLAQENPQHASHDTHNLLPDSKAYIARLEDPKRDEYQKPHQVISALNLKEGEVVADIGAGSGYFTFRLARHVGDTGRVYAVDVNPEMIVHLNRRIRELKVKNVVSWLAPSDDPLLAEASIDRFFICNTWHHIEHHDQYLALLRKMLKPGGEIVMVDFKKVATPLGPPLEMRIDRADLVKEMEMNGFRVEADHTLLPYQYFLVFKVKL
jgi:ubiquinone/menaquinone biosynthesis C-methylase UbiE